MQERDFLGLGSHVKEETPADEISEFARSLAMEGSSSNKVAAVPQFLSFQCFQEEKPKNIGFNSLTSNGLVSITRAHTFESEKKVPFGVAQKNIIPDNLCGFGMSTYHANLSDSLTTRHSFNSRTNIAVPQPVSTNVNQSFIATTGLNLAGPVQALPSSCNILENTHLRNAPVISTMPAQLTLFYAGSVCVYDNISPEKAQAIMLLAGNSSHLTNCSTIPAVHVPLSIPGFSGLDGLSFGQNYGATLHSNYPIPMTISEPCDINTADVKPAAVLASSSCKSDLPNLVNSSSISSNTVPQFRRKSLARFLEKRRERLVVASPYDVETQPVDCSTTRAGSTSLSINSSGSSPLPSIS